MNSFSGLRRKLDFSAGDDDVNESTALWGISSPSPQRKAMLRFGREKQFLEDMYTTTFIENEILKLKSSLALQQVKEKLHQADDYIDNEQKKYVSPNHSFLLNNPNTSAFDIANKQSSSKTNTPSRTNNYLN